MDRFYYLRHGQVAANLARILCGGDWQDISLNDTGRAQIKACASALIQLPHNIRTVCISPTLRTRETASILADSAPQARHVVIEELCEWRLGQWDRKPYEEVIPKGTSLMDYDPPEGETREQFGQRIARAFDVCRQQEGDVLIISHGAVWGALTRYLGLENFVCGNGTLLEVRLKEKRKIRELFSLPQE